RDKKAEGVAKVFMERWVLDGGRMPKCLLSDNGSEFVNEVMGEISRLYAIERKTTLPYHSRGNGTTERWNRTLAELLRRVASRPDQWDDALPYACHAYKNSPHATTGETPLFIAYGRDESLPIGVVPQEESSHACDVDEYKA